MKNIFINLITVISVSTFIFGNDHYNEYFKRHRMGAQAQRLADIANADKGRNDINFTKLDTVDYENLIKNIREEMKNEARMCDKNAKTANDFSLCAQLYLMYAWSLEFDKSQPNKK